MKSALLILLALVATLFTGCETTGVQSGVVAHTNVSTPSPYDFQRFRVADKIKIEFSGSESFRLQTIETEIKDDGTVSFELIGAQKAAGLTARELEVSIRTNYVPKYFNQINVVVSSPDRVYYVFGQVKQPGARPYLGRVTVLQAIASAGDFTDFADKKKVVITRPGGHRLVVDCKAAVKKPALDIEIFPNDSINVPQGL